MVDGEGALLDGGSEITAGVRGIFGIKRGQSVERSKQIRVVRTSLQNLLQLPGKPRRQRRRRPHRRSFNR